MKIEKAIIVLTKYNRWRRGEDMPMLQPKVVSEAIDTVLKALTTKP